MANGQSEHALTGRGPACGRRVTVVEVSPRDGLQSLDHAVDTDHKLAFIERLLDAGLTAIEATSFAHPRMVPHLSDGAELMRRLPRRPGVSYRALVPNRRGAERAIEAGADVLVAFVSASAAYSEKNQNMTTAQALDGLEGIGELAREAAVGFGVGISMAFASPYGETIAAADVLALVQRCAAMDPTDLYVADTVGRATPAHVRDLCSAIHTRWPALKLSVHLHGGADARALACAVAAVGAGVSQVESSMCGLGGPVVRSPGTAPVGNLATEAAVRTFAELGIDTGLSPDAVADAATDVAQLIDIAAPRDRVPAAEVARLARA